MKNDETEGWTGAELKSNSNYTEEFGSILWAMGIHGRIIYKHIILFLLIWKERF